MGRYTQSAYMDKDEIHNLFQYKEGFIEELKTFSAVHEYADAYIKFYSLNHMSFKVYDTKELWWIIPLYNGFVDNIIPENTTLFLPSIEDINSFLYKWGS